MIPNKIILFDIDRTLLDTDQLIHLIPNMISEISSINIDEVNKLTEKYINSLDAIFFFDFVEMLNTFELSDEVYRGIIDQYENNTELYPKFADVISSLEQCKGIGMRIGIFSEGTPNFQHNKLKNLNVDKYIDDDLVFIAQTKRTKNFLDSLPAGCTIVDDNSEVIDVLAEDGRFNIIHIVRESSKYPKSSYKNIKVINSLNEILNLDLEQ